jgi:GT2 family glycosyltransferase
LGSTGAFLMISKKLFFEVGKFNEEYVDSLEDVELNMRCLANNKTNYFVGDAVCYHLESQTRDISKGNINQSDYQRLSQYINKEPNHVKIIQHFKSLPIKQKEEDKKEEEVVG